jgi:hypothetical protein
MFRQVDLGKTSLPQQASQPIATPLLAYKLFQALSPRFSQDLFFAEQCLFSLVSHYAIYQVNLHEVLELVSGFDHAAMSHPTGCEYDFPTS